MLLVLVLKQYQVFSKVSRYCSVATKWLVYLFLIFFLTSAVAFRIYDMDKDGYISNGELFQVLKMMVGNNLKDTQLQQIVDKTIINADKDGDGRISFEEFCAVSNFKRKLVSFTEREKNLSSAALEKE